MRKIEQRMNAAILGNFNWSSSNTEVIADHDGVSRVYLHGNKIAEIGDNFITLMDGGWQSNTTKSRLNAILRVHGLGEERIFQRNFEWFIDCGGEEIEFVSGMTL